MTRKSKREVAQSIEELEETSPAETAGIATFVRCAFGDYDHVEGNVWDTNGHGKIRVDMDGLESFIERMKEES